MLNITLTDRSAAALANQSTSENAFPISSVLLVAALMRSEGGHTVLRENDDAYLAAMIEAGPHVGVRFLPQVQVKACNIRIISNGLQGDFLRAASGELPDSKADMVGFGFVYYNPKGNGRCNIDNSLYTQSTLATVPGIWHDALSMTGARFAFNVIRDRKSDELPTQLLEGPNFEVVARNLPCCAAGKRIDVLGRRGLVA
ncbi:MAG: hypothetical protein KGQ41_02985 [Alphaproteobacteria bacterium]|nr:hypothetical protein [Alphaproteobacteria bacterium]